MMKRARVRASRPAAAAERSVDVDDETRRRRPLSAWASGKPSASHHRSHRFQPKSRSQHVQRQGILTEWKIRAVGRRSQRVRRNRAPCTFSAALQPAVKSVTVTEKAPHKRSEDWAASPPFSSSAPSGNSKTALPRRRGRRSRKTFTKIKGFHALGKRSSLAVKSWNVKEIVISRTRRHGDRACSSSSGRADKHLSPVRALSGTTLILVCRHQIRPPVSPCPHPDHFVPRDVIASVSIARARRVTPRPLARAPDARGIIHRVDLFRRDRGGRRASRRGRPRVIARAAAGTRAVGVHREDDRACA